MSNEINKYLIQYKELYDSKLYFEKNNNYIPFLNTPNISPNDYITSEGNYNSNIIFIGAMNLSNDSFSGKSGNLLDKILAAINLTRKDIFILNINCKSLDENDLLGIDKFRFCLIEKIKYNSPKIVVALGEMVGKILIDNDSDLSNMRNNIFKYENSDIIVTYDTCTLINQPELKKEAWEDYKLIRDRYIDGK